MDTPTHTPLPWLGEVNGYLTTKAQDGKYTYIANFALVDLPMSENEANAAFALRAVNSHDDLVDALLRLYRNGDKHGWHDGYEADMDFASAVLSEAMGEA